MADKTYKAVFVGAGNVGLHAILSLALVIKQEDDRRQWDIAIVDYDRVAEKDIGKGYQRASLRRYKAEAAVDLVEIAYGKKTASRFRPLKAAAQSLPGLFRNADVVFNGTDSNLCAAFVSEQACNTLEIRLSTGKFGGTAVHSVEVLPEGFTLGTNSYDTAAWADCARYHCKFGTPENSFAGVAQPFGTVTGALAVHLFLARKQKREKRHYFIQVSGEKITQSFGSQLKSKLMRESREIPFSYDFSLSDLWGRVAGLLGVKSKEVLLGFPVPLVIRQCGQSCDHEIYWGFERQPPSGICQVCGAWTYCIHSPREVSLEDIRPIADKNLKKLNAPAGMDFTAWTRAGRKMKYHLPFHYDDIPKLLEVEATEHIRQDKARQVRRASVRK